MFQDKILLCWSPNSVKVKAFSLIKVCWLSKLSVCVIVLDVLQVSND